MYTMRIVEESETEHDRKEGWDKYKSKSEIWQESDINAHIM